MLQTFLADFVTVSVFRRFLSRGNDRTEYARLASLTWKFMLSKTPRIRQLVGLELTSPDIRNLF
jgi:hypothetical protein